MRVEKKYLIEEVAGHLRKSDYVILTNFDRMTVADVAELRSRLTAHKAEFHVVKNSSLRVAAQALGLPSLDNALTGPTAIIVGGRNSPGVAKVVRDFFKEKQKIEVKGGVLGKKLITAKEISQLADLPSLDALRAQLLGLLNQPAGMFVRVLNAVPQGVVNVLQAKIRTADTK
ncbi:MAG: 50S ribosomal protein L10 [Verrucomicrobia bacterium RIFCSPLOWO2_12_FULL_64_8]|nr:MAG: 50S ribosomal protein L10 [Verrucomicrobia bacterium RIFCSPLOWO2_12_FULL_64_8]